VEHLWNVKINIYNNKLNVYIGLQLNSRTIPVIFALVGNNMTQVPKFCHKLQGLTT